MTDIIELLEAWADDLEFLADGEELQPHNHPEHHKMDSHEAQAGLVRQTISALKAKDAEIAELMAVSQMLVDARLRTGKIDGFKLGELWDAYNKARALLKETP